MNTIANRLSNSYEAGDILQTAILVKVLNKSMDNQELMMQKMLEAIPPVPGPSHLGKSIDIKI